MSSLTLPRLTTLIAVAAAALFPTQAALAEEVQPAIAIIIDDMGHDSANSREVVMIDAPLTLSFLPFRAATTSQAVEAFRQGKEIMLHIPMQNIHRMALGPSALTEDMSDMEIGSTLQAAISDIPFVSGVNNHMGSLLTQDVRAMSAVMKTIGRLHVPQLYFVDSRTTAQTVALDTALRYRIPAMKRDVFLDNTIDRDSIRAEFKRLVALARRNGTAIAIGHPHRETIDVLKEELSTLAEQGVTLASVSGLLQIVAQRNDSDISQSGYAAAQAGAPAPAD